MTLRFAHKSKNNIILNIQIQKRKIKHKVLQKYKLNAQTSTAIHKQQNTKLD